MRLTSLFLLALTVLTSPYANAAEAANALWGTAPTLEREYKDQKVVYDVAAKSVAEFNGVLDRASYLSQLNGSDPFTTSIVLVLHGDELNYFATKNFSKYKDIMERAQSLTVGEVIHFRVCAAAARSRGLTAEDLHGFVQMVPMADAEIVRLQLDEGHAYMR
jgi:hypothetical protein